MFVHKLYVHLIHARNKHSIDCMYIFFKNISHGSSFCFLLFSPYSSFFFFFFFSVFVHSFWFCKNSFFCVYVRAYTHKKKKYLQFFAHEKKRRRRKYRHTDRIQTGVCDKRINLHPHGIPWLADEGTCLLFLSFSK